MARKKKNGKTINCLLDATIHDMLEEYANDKGQTKTMAIERLLEKELVPYFQEKRKNLPASNEN